VKSDQELPVAYRPNFEAFSFGRCIPYTAFTVTFFTGRRVNPPARLYWLRDGGESRALACVAFSLVLTHNHCLEFRLQKIACTGGAGSVGFSCSAPLHYQIAQHMTLDFSASRHQIVHGQMPVGSPLTAQIALRILEMVQTGQAPVGGHLRESVIADEFRVSRSPVREALQELARLGVVSHHPNRGSFVAAAPRRTLELARKGLARDDNGVVYREIAAQRLDGKLAEMFSEADLGRQFGLSRAEVSRVVDRMTQEGWIERRPGYGWAFVPILTTVASFDLSYRFRRTIEPAALLEPTFSPDPEALSRCRVEQRALLEGKVYGVNSIKLFGFGSRFHEMLAKCSGNPFFYDAVQRVNRLRRLLEYRVIDDMRPFRNEAREHLDMLDLVEAGRMQERQSSWRGISTATAKSNCESLMLRVLALKEEQGPS
jgi:DNA-binding GntR family transcriptional regulator